MRPTKNHNYCPQCGRCKIKFYTRAEAQRFIDYNYDEIREQGGHAPNRTYYCTQCRCWHVTSSPYRYGRKSEMRRMRRYDMEMEKAFKADTRHLVKEMAATLHEINRHVKGHDGGADYPRAHYTLLMQKVVATYEQTADSLTKRQREKIYHRIYEIKATESDSQTANGKALAKRGRLMRKAHTLRSHRHETGGLWRQTCNG